MAARRSVVTARLGEPLIPPTQRWPQVCHLVFLRITTTRAACSSMRIAGIFPQPWFVPHASQKNPVVFFGRQERPDSAEPAPSRASAQLDTCFHRLVLRAVLETTKRSELTLT